MESSVEKMQDLQVFVENLEEDDTELFFYV